MNFYQDVHDWLGGFPHETATANELHDRVCSLTFPKNDRFEFRYQLEFSVLVAMSLFSTRDIEPTYSLGRRNLPNS